MTGRTFLAVLLAALGGPLALPAVAQEPPNPAALRQAKLAAAAKAYKAAADQFGRDRASPERVYQWSLRWMEAQREALGTPAQALVAVQAHLERMRALRKGLSSSQAPYVDYYVAEAELIVQQVRSLRPKGP